MITIAISSPKGGVGKTTTALNLGAALLDVNLPVRLVDFDNGPLLDYKKALPGALFTDNMREQFAGATLIDCAPAQEDGRAFKIISVADVVLIPTAPNRTACEQALDMAEMVLETRRAVARLLFVKFKKRDFVLKNYADAEKSLKKMGKGIGPGAARLCWPTVPLSEHFELAEEDKKTIFQQAPRSHGARAYRELAQEVLQSWL